MRAFLLGATGNTGREVVDILLARDHRVTAFVRSPQKITRKDPALDIVPGALEVDALARALEGHDVVISTLGLPPAQALRPSRFMAESGATTVAAMARANVGRLVILSAGVLFPGSGLAYAFFSFLLRHHARDLAAMEDIVKAGDLAWTIARPPRLVHAPSGEYRARTGALPEGKSTATFRAVASFLVDAAEARTHVGETVGIVSA